MKEYIENRKTLLDIANDLGVANTVIRRHLIESGAEIRKKGYGFNVLPEKILTKEQYDFFDGLVLSDGSICRRNTTRGRKTIGNDFLSCAFKYSEFAEYIKNKLNLKPKVHKKIHKSDRYKSGQCVQYGIVSSPNVFFTKERDRWYPCGKKIIPSDFRFSPVSLNIAYLGDGNMTRGSASIATVNFPIDDLKWFVGRLNSILGTTAYMTGINEIKFFKRETPIFLNYIGDCPVDCYKYKWKIQ